MEESTFVVIRDVDCGSDHAFVYSTWRNALWFAEKRDPKDADTFYKEASERIAALLKPPTRLKIACLGDDSDMLLGWAVLQGDHLEFVYVKIDYRRKGIGRLLTKGFKTFSKPQTRIGKKLAKAFKEKLDGRKEEAQVQPH